MPVPSGPGPHRQHLQVGPWQVDLHAHQGRVRRRIEDAWATAERVPLGRHEVDAFAVFDGLGGVAHGQEAAWAAADGLRAALDSAAGPGDVLATLNERVLPTGGSTTAVVLLMARAATGPWEGWLVSVGDSSAYAAVGSQPFSRLNPHDRRSRHVLSDWLGRPSIGGHARALQLTGTEVVVLCTDGVDEVVDVDQVRQVAEAGAAVGPALDELFAQIHAAGAPDNAAVMVVQRTPDRA